MKNILDTKNLLDNKHFYNINKFFNAKNLRRRVSIIMTAAILAIDFASPVAAAVDTSYSYSDGIQTADQNDIIGDTSGDTSGDISGDSGATGGLTEENFEEQAIDAVKRAEAQLAGEGNTLNNYYVSENGSTIIGDVTNEDGEKNYILDSDEEFIYDPSHEGEKEGFEYMGTGAESVYLRRL